MIVLSSAHSIRTIQQNDRVEALTAKLTSANRRRVSAHPFPEPGESRGVEHTSVIDLMTHHAKTDEVEIVMFEPRPWHGGELQLFQLQEKLNAYISFILDGEMSENYPQLTGKSVRVVLRCVEAPPEPAVQFLAGCPQAGRGRGNEIETLTIRQSVPALRA